MSDSPTPLPEGTVVGARYEIQSLLGQGGFGITYLAQDVELEKVCVIKELAPTGTSRQENLTLNFERLGPAATQRLRRQFLHESAVLRKMHIPSVVSAYAEFSDFGTIYLVMPRLEGAIPLNRLIQSEGRMDPLAVHEFMDRMLNVLQEVHKHGVLHRDIKPSNILIDPHGDPWLIDFGSAREWIADLTLQHTVQFTPGYAPLEQLSERARRGPGTDLYGLCATAWAMLLGEPPISALDRAAGSPLPRLQVLRPDVPPVLAETIEAGLELSLDKRPRDAAALRSQLNAFDSGGGKLPWQALDVQQAVLQKLKVRKRECPNCSDVLIAPKPLKDDQCIVCRNGKITPRDLNERRCPFCATGVLGRISNVDPLRFCPACRFGELKASGIKIPWAQRSLTCMQCSATFHEKGGQVSLATSDEAFTWEELREHSGRSDTVWKCDGCHSQLDVLEDGRWKAISPRVHPKGHTELFPEEWARVAVGLDPGVGNAFCPKCEADYFSEGDHLTLLTVPDNFAKLADVLEGRLFTRYQARWAGAGKLSGMPGWVCEHCQVEFDTEDEQLKLVREPVTGNHKTALAENLGQTFELANWHRIARRLPLVGDEALLDEALVEAILEAYCDGELGGDPFWVARGTLAGGKKVNLTFDSEGVILGGMLRKTRIPWREISHIEALDEDHIVFTQGNEERIVLFSEPAILELKLESGDRRLLLTAYELAARSRTAKARSG